MALGQDEVMKILVVKLVIGDVILVTKVTDEKTFFFLFYCIILF